jgi:transcriptional regulator GlxA family with amidase domain/YHS domain-containing protein
MKRRELLQRSAALGLFAAMPFPAAGKRSTTGTDANNSAAKASALKPPEQGSIPVAFLVSDGAVVIDFCGPWEVFQDTYIPSRNGNPFQLYTVAETTKPITASGGMKILPDHDFTTAPAPKVIVIPAQSTRTPATLDWIRKSSKSADLTMSVCTGAFLLGQTGLLAGKAATTHHASYRTFALQFQNVQLKRGARFVEDGNLASAGGLSSGIDLALRVVERYFGRDVATETAFQMEYQGQGWLNPDSNEMYAKARRSSLEHPLCPVCGMEVDPKTSASSVYQATTYYFCSSDHKAKFDASPATFLD